MLNIGGAFLLPEAMLLCEERVGGRLTEGDLYR